MWNSSWEDSVSRSNSYFRRRGFLIVPGAVVLAAVSFGVLKASHANPIITSVNEFTAVSPAQLDIIGTGLASTSGPCGRTTVSLGGTPLYVLSFTSTLVTVQIPSSILNSPGTYRLLLDSCQSDDSSGADFYVVIGASGQSGATGPTGALGATGASGPNGADGATGASGPIGASGLAGTNGPTGPTGPVGPTGAAGATGAQGLAGTAGPTGTTGPVGPTGAAGATGAQGLAGAAGSTGPTGPVGPTGAAGATGAQGLAGAAGATGPTGPVGPPGA